MSERSVYGEVFSSDAVLCSTADLCAPAALRRQVLWGPVSTQVCEDTSMWCSPDGVGCDLVAVGPQVLHLLVVGPLVRHVERGRDRTAVGVLATRLKHFLVQFAINVVDRVVKGEQHQLGSGLGLEVAWMDCDSVSGFKDKQTNRHADRQLDRQPDRQTGRRTMDCQTDGHKAAMLEEAFGRRFSKRRNI